MWSYIIGCVALATLATAQVDPRCDGASIIRGFGYLPDTSRCDCWIRCTFDDTRAAVKSEQECCGCGKFWNQNILTCYPARDVTCANDQCSGGGRNSYAYPGNCRTYFTCDGTRTSGGACCNVGQRYDAGTQACVADATCTDDCLCVDKTTLAPPTCAFKVNPLDDKTYIETVNGEEVIRACPPGTSYNATACKCSTFVDVPRPACPVDFDVQCNSDPLRDSANDVYIANNDVDVDLDTNTCVFDGAANLLVARYANMAWRDAFAIYISFNPGTNQNADAPLFVNSACATGQGPSSLGITLRQTSDGPVVEFSARVGSPPTARNVRVRYSNNQDNEVFASYDGQKMRLCVRTGGNVLSAEEDVTGLVAQVECSVRYGQDDSNNSFQGSISSSRVHVFCVPENFCPS